MAWIPKIAIILFHAALINHALTGNAQAVQHGSCTLSDIKVTQVKTGKLVQGQPEYQVTVENLCPCIMDNVQLHCNRLPTAEPVDSKKLKVEDVLCKLSSELFKGSPVTFTYAWKTPQDFAIVSADSPCLSADKKSHV